MHLTDDATLLRLASLTRDLDSQDDHARDTAYRDLLSLAEQGDGRAMFQIARCLNQGIAVPLDPVRADFWLRRACVAKPPSHDAIFSYGMSHVLKQRPDADTAKGISFLERAASAGYVRATLALVQLIETGTSDIRPDLKRAFRLLAGAVCEGQDQALYDAYTRFVERHQPISNLLDS